MKKTYCRCRSSTWGDIFQKLLFTLKDILEPCLFMYKIMCRIIVVLCVIILNFYFISFFKMIFVYVCESFKELENSVICTLSSTRQKKFF